MISDLLSTALGSMRRLPVQYGQVLKSLLGVPTERGIFLSMGKFQEELDKIAELGAVGRALIEFAKSLRQRENKLNRSEGRKEWILRPESFVGIQVQKKNCVSAYSWGLGGFLSLIP